VDRHKHSVKQAQPDSRVDAESTNDGLKALTDMYGKTHRQIKRRTGRDQAQPDSRVDSESANDGLKALTDKHMKKHKHSWTDRSGTT
jgi:hypothetical protein